MLELELDAAVGGGGGDGLAAGECGVRVGDVVRVGAVPAAGRKGERGGVEGVVVRVGRGLGVAVGEGTGEEGEDGLGGRLWV